jgi:uncharacterized RDD family membrane protein YckC
MDKGSTINQTRWPAGFISRFEAFIVDLLILTISGLAATWGVQLIIQFFGLNLIFRNLGSGLFAPIIFPIVTLVYFLFFWTFLGYTPGKLLLGLMIVRPDGRKLSLGRSVLRFFGYWVSAIPLFLGFIWIIFDRRRQGWHDKLADTQVLYVPRKSRRAQKNRQSMADRRRNDDTIANQG